MERLVNLVYHFAIPCRMLRWQPIKVAKSFFSGPIFIVTLPFGNGLQNCNSDFNRFNDMNFSALCRVLVRFGAVTPEFMLLKKDNFCLDTLQVW